MKYQLVLEKEVIKFLKKLQKEDAKRILLKIKELETNPYPSNSKRILNTKELTFRIRIGKFRALYRIEDNKLVIVFLIDKRSKVYD